MQIYRKFLRGSEVHDDPALDLRDSTGNRIIGNHWSINESFLISSREFLEESLRKYYDGPIVGQERVLLSRLLAGEN
jgi:hypothetical protein